LTILPSTYPAHAWWLWTWPGSCSPPVRRGREAHCIACLRMRTRRKETRRNRLNSEVSKHEPPDIRIFFPHSEVRSKICTRWWWEFAANMALVNPAAPPPITTIFFMLMNCKITTIENRLVSLLLKIWEQIARAWHEQKSDGIGPPNLMP
jgi:hypothetical protein